MTKVTSLTGNLGGTSLILPTGATALTSSTSAVGGVGSLSSTGVTGVGGAGTQWGSFGTQGPSTGTVIRSQLPKDQPLPQPLAEAFESFK